MTKSVAGLLGIWLVFHSTARGDAGDCEAELKRLQKAFDAAHAERAQLARELNEARKRIAALEAARPIDPDRPPDGDDPRELVLGYFRFLNEGLPAGRTREDARFKLGLLAVLEGGLKDVTRGSRAGRGLFDPSLDYLREAVRRQQTLAAGLPAQGAAAADPWLAELRAGRDGAAFKQMLDDAPDRVAAAKAAGRWIGRPVEWPGTVIVGPNRYVSGWEYTLDCGGMTVRATVAHPLIGDVKVGAAVRVAGTIGGEDADIVNTQTVHLSDCEIATEAAYPELLKARRKKR